MASFNRACPELPVKREASVVSPLTAPTSLHSLACCCPSPSSCPRATASGLPPGPSRALAHSLSTSLVPCLWWCMGEGVGGELW